MLNKFICRIFQGLFNIHLIFTYKIYLQRIPRIKITFIRFKIYTMLLIQVIWFIAMPIGKTAVKIINYNPFSSPVKSIFLPTTIRCSNPESFCSSIPT